MRSGRKSLSGKELRDFNELIFRQSARRSPKAVALATDKGFDAADDKKEPLKS